MEIGHKIRVSFPPDARDDREPNNRGLKAEAQTLREIDEPNVGGTLVPAGTLLLVCQYKSAKREGKSRADVCRTN